MGTNDIVPGLSDDQLDAIFARVERDAVGDDGRVDVGGIRVMIGDVGLAGVVGRNSVEEVRAALVHRANMELLIELELRDAADSVCSVLSNPDTPLSVLKEACRLSRFARFRTVIAAHRACDPELCVMLGESKSFTVHEALAVNPAFAKADVPDALVEQMFGGLCARSNGGLLVRMFVNAYCRGTWDRMKRIGLQFVARGYGELELFSGGYVFDLARLLDVDDETVRGILHIGK